MRVVRPLSCVLALLNSGALSAGEHLVDADLIGAWKLVHTGIVTPDGRSYPVPNYGSDPHGYLIYDRSHVMCVFLAVGETRDPPPERYRNLMPAIPASYCALWHISDDGQTVLHEVQVGNDPALIGTTMRRKAARDGRTLTLRRDPVPEGLRDYFLTFERVNSEFLTLDRAGSGNSQHREAQ